MIEVLRSGWLGTGPRVARFEQAFAAYVGTSAAIGMSSCTAGLYLALRALGIVAGDEIITSPVTFPSTVNAIVQLGARPVFADVLPGWLTLDAEAVHGAVTPRTRAIVAVHFAGWPCDMEALAAVRRSGIAVVEDAAHALGATYRGRHAGALGDAASFSFYATKNITTGEGGMVTTNRADLVPRLRRERLHGIDIDASERAGATYAHWEAVSEGWKFNLTDIAAALGLEQLAKLPAFLARRRALDASYRARLRELPAFEPIGGPPESESAAHLFPVLMRPGALRIDRDTMLKALLAENIGVGVHFRALPLHRSFRDGLGVDPEAYPVAMDASQRVFSLPLYPAMTDADQRDVLEALERISRFYRA